jgi:tetratricopeptide (TPR) repeat protein
VQIGRFYLAAITFVSGCALVGCSGTSPFESQPANPYSTAQDANSSSESPYERLVQTFSTQDENATDSSQLPSQMPAEPDNSWLASMRNAGESIGESINAAFTIPTQTTTAPDPTSLLGQTEDVGGELNYRAAKFQESLNNTESAIALYQKALEADPNDMRTMISYARLLDRTGRFREAEQLYLRSLEIEPENVIALNDLGMIYARQGMLDAALEPLAKAIELQPTSQRYRNNMAIVLVDAGRDDEAFEQLVLVHEAATAHYNVAYLLSRREQNDKAMWHLQQSLALNPDMVPARQLLESVAMTTPIPRGPEVVIQPYQTVSENPTPETAIPVMQHTPSIRPLPPF